MPSPAITNNGDLLGGHLNHTGPVYPEANWGDIIPPYEYRTPNGQLQRLRRRQLARRGRRSTRTTATRRGFRLRLTRRRRAGASSTTCRVTASTITAIPAWPAGRSVRTRTTAPGTASSTRMSSPTASWTRTRLPPTQAPTASSSLRAATSSARSRRRGGRRRSRPAGRRSATRARAWELRATPSPWPPVTTTRGTPSATRSLSRPSTTSVTRPATRAFHTAWNPRRSSSAALWRATTACTGAISSHRTPTSTRTASPTSSPARTGMSRARRPCSTTASRRRRLPPIPS